MLNKMCTLSLHVDGFIRLSTPSYVVLVVRFSRDSIVDLPYSHAGSAIIADVLLFATGEWR